MMENEVLVFSGNPKAGSTWLGGLFSGVAIESGLDFFYGQYALPDNHVKIKAGRYDMVISQSSNYQKLQELNRPYKCVHVIRDPRDVCISSYFSFKKTHNIEGWLALKELRDRLHNLSFDEGMLETIKFNSYFFETLKNWNYDDDNVFEIKYEDMIKAPEYYAIQIFDFLGLIYDNSPSQLNDIKALYNRIIFKQRALYNLFRFRQKGLILNRIKAINTNLSFSKLSKGRERGKENTSSHYRKGTSGDWKNHFSDAMKNYFKEEYGSLLIKLRYERDDNW